MDYFGLTRCQAMVMFGQQYLLVVSDIKREPDYAKKALKEKWLSQWKDGIDTFINKINKEAFTDDISYLAKITESPMKFTDKCFSGEYGYLNRVKVFVEIVLFCPYYQLDDEPEKYKQLQISDQEQWKQELRVLAGYFKFSPNTPERIKENFKKALAHINGKQFNPFFALVGALFFVLLAPFAIPAIVALLAPIIVPGVYGAAAYAAVMAALGGGAVAVGGAGMAGGFAVVVAGGAILGAAAGAGVSSLLKESPEFVASQGAKLIVVVKELFLDDRVVAKKVACDSIKQLRQSIRSVEDEADDLRSKDMTDDLKRQVENLNKTKKYLDGTINQIEELLE
uniref:Glycine zipper family protein n=1 Tax=Cyanothece sp. (strain PCC 7425 / ATCC 29141) TaxID=395961 RepID=B8HLK9_CYAP4